MVLFNHQKAWPVELPVLSGSSYHLARIASVATTGSGTFPYASDPENTFEVPSALLQSTVTSVTITALFSDGSTATVALGPSQLGVENASYVMK